MNDLIMNQICDIWPPSVTLTLDPRIMIVECEHPQMIEINYGKFHASDSCVNGDKALSLY